MNRIIDSRPESRPGEHRELPRRRGRKRDRYSSPEHGPLTLRTVLTVCLGILSILAVGWFVMRTTVALTLALTSLLIAIALHHLVDFLISRRVPRAFAIAIAVLSTLGVMTAFAVAVIPPAFAQAKALVESLPSFLKHARESQAFADLDQHLHISTRLDDLERRLPALVEGAAAPLITVAGGVLSALGAGASVLVLAVFMLIFGRDLVQAALGEALPERRARYHDVLCKIYRSLGGYLGGLLLICSINACLTSTFLALMRVPFFLPLGLVSGFSSLIPYAGPAVAGALISITAGATGGLLKGLGCAIYFVLYGQLEGNFLGPMVFRRTAHVNPLVVTLALLFLSELGGIFGAIVAVPAVAAAQVLLGELLRARRERLRLPPLEESPDRS